MANKLSWLNPRSLRQATDLWGSSSGKRPILFFSCDEPDVLNARLAAREYTFNDYDVTLHPSLTKAPSGLSLIDSVAFSDEGTLRIVLPSQNNEALYPAIDALQIADDEVLRSFALVVTDLRQYHQDTRNYPFSVVPHLYLVGSVGAYQSGSDIEFEAMDKWRIGRPLYIENNVLDTPFKLLR